VQIAVACKAVPLLRDAIVSGEIPPTVARQIAGVITPENANDIVSRLAGKSYREARAGVMEIRGLYAESDIPGASAPRTRV
jgi:hypothetical protein